MQVNQSSSSSSSCCTLLSLNTAEKSQLESLPLVLSNLIVCHLRPRQIESLSGVSRSFCALLSPQNQVTWKVICLAQFPKAIQGNVQDEAQATNSTSGVAIDYRHLFLSQSKFLKADAWLQRAPTILFLRISKFLAPNDSLNLAKTSTTCLTIKKLELSEIARKRELKNFRRFLSKSAF